MGDRKNSIPLSSIRVYEASPRRMLLEASRGIIAFKKDFNRDILEKKILRKVITKDILQSYQIR